MSQEDPFFGCCCVRLLMLPVMTLLYGQQRMNHRIRHVVHRMKQSASLSQRAKDMHQRNQELELDHLEMHGKCCVCKKEGVRVAGRSVPDGGLTVVDENDLDELSAIFGVPVRGYLCPTCLDVAVQIRVRRALGNATREAEVQAGEETLPAWAIAAALSRKCDLCQVVVPAFYHPQHAELLCRRCVVVRGHKRTARAIVRPMPADMRTAVQMLLHEHRPADATRASANYHQSRALFSGQDIDLFRSSKAKRPPAAGAAMGDNHPADTSTTSMSTSPKGALDPQPGCLPEAVAPDRVAYHYSEARFEEDPNRGANTTEDLRQKLRRTGLSLFEGRRLDAVTEGQEKRDLFADYWGPGAPGQPSAAGSNQRRSTRRPAPPEFMTRGMGSAPPTPRHAPSSTKASRASKKTFRGTPFDGPESMSASEPPSRDEPPSRAEPEGSEASQAIAFELPQQAHAFPNATATDATGQCVLPSGDELRTNTTRSEADMIEEHPAEGPGAKLQERTGDHPTEAEHPKEDREAEQVENNRDDHPTLPTDAASDERPDALPEEHGAESSEAERPRDEAQPGNNHDAAPAVDSEPHTPHAQRQKSSDGTPSATVASSHTSEGSERLGDGTHDEQLAHHSGPHTTTIDEEPDRCAGQSPSPESTETPTATD
jgi:hypothetical protein